MKVNLLAAGERSNGCLLKEMLSVKSQTGHCITSALKLRLHHTLLSNKKAPGLDSLPPPPEIFKECIHWWCPILTTKCDVIILEGVCPIYWNANIIVPIFKNGEKRGYSLLCIPAKRFGRHLGLLYLHVGEGMMEFNA